MDNEQNEIRCCECEGVVDIDEITTYNDNGYCQDCFGKMFSFCAMCDDVVNDNDAILLADGRVCERCYDTYYFTCECCGEIFNNDYYGGDGYCVDCYEVEEAESESENGLLDYDYKPDPLFYGDSDSDLFFGIELEIESAGHNIFDAVQTLPEFVYAKADSSMNNGLEVVSHPLSWSWLQANKKQWDKVLNLRDDGFLSYKTDTCGMHIHLSKKAFSTLHLYKFLKMFFESQNFITIISRRKSASLAQWASLVSDESIVYKAKNKNNTRRHTAVNLQNPESVEVRIFRGTLSPIGFWRNIEFCKATYEFTKIMSIKDITANKLCAYIAEQEQEYPNLIQFLRDKELVERLI